MTKIDFSNWVLNIFEQSNTITLSSVFCAFRIFLLWFYCKDIRMESRLLAPTHQVEGGSWPIRKWDAMPLSVDPVLPKSTFQHWRSWYFSVLVPESLLQILDSVYTIYGKLLNDVRVRARLFLIHQASQWHGIEMLAVDYGTTHTKNRSRYINNIYFTEKSIMTSYNTSSNRTLVIERYTTSSGDTVAKRANCDNTFASTRISLKLSHFLHSEAASILGAADPPHDWQWSEESVRIETHVL